MAASSSSKRSFPPPTAAAAAAGGDGSPVRNPKRPRLRLHSYKEVTTDLFLDRLFRRLEPLIRGVVQEEFQKSHLNHRPLKIQEVVSSRLFFQDRLPDELLTDTKIKVGDKMPLQVVLKDANSGNIITSGSLSSSNIKIVVLNADFGGERQEGWTEEEFVNHVVSEREGRRPLLIGDLSIKLSNGVGRIVNASFTDNSSWTRSKKFRLGAISESRCPGGRVQEAISEAFKVKDCRVKLKHHPPSLNDAAYCLKSIGKDGAFHKKLVGDGINTVQDFLRSFILGPDRLRNLLGSRMSDKRWEETHKHASGCILGNKLYSYCIAEQGIIPVFNSIFQLVGAKIDGFYHPLDKLTAYQKDSVNQLKELAYKNPGEIVEFHGTLVSSLPRPLPTMGVTSIPGSSLSDSKIPNLPATCHGEPSIQVGLQHPPYAPHNDFLGDLSQHKDISTECGFESVHQVASLQKEDSSWVSVDAHHPGSHSLRPQFPNLAATHHAASSRNGFGGSFRTEEILDYDPPILLSDAGASSRNSFGRSFSTDKMLDSDTPMNEEDIMAMFREMLHSLGGETSTGAAPGLPGCSSDPLSPQVGQANRCPEVDVG